MTEAIPVSVSEKRESRPFVQYDTSNTERLDTASIGSNGVVGLGSDVVKAGSDFYMLGTPINGQPAQQTLYKFDGATWTTTTPPPYSLTYGSLVYDDDAGKIIALTDVGTLMYFNPATRNGAIRSTGRLSIPIAHEPHNDEWCYGNIPVPRPEYADML
jgi:hypothetical protein